MDITYIVLEGEQNLNLDFNVKVKYHTSKEFLEDYSRWILGELQKENRSIENEQKKRRNLRDDISKFLKRTNGKYNIIIREETFKGERRVSIIEPSKNYVIDVNGKARFIPD